MELITSERKGRSIVLRTTDYFADYFGLSRDVAAMKRELRKILGMAAIEEKEEKQFPTSS